MLPGGFELEVMAEIDVNDVDFVGFPFRSDDLDEILLSFIAIEVLVLFHDKVHL